MSPCPYPATITITPRAPPCKSLRNNVSIVISKSDKGPGIVISNRHDYDKEIADILNDTPILYVSVVLMNLTKLPYKSDVSNVSCSDFIKTIIIPKNIEQKIHSIGSQRQRLRGLLKTHKPNVPLRSILRLVGSA